MVLMGSYYKSWGSGVDVEGIEIRCFCVFLEVGQSEIFEQVLAKWNGWVMKESLEDPPLSFPRGSMAL